MQPLGASPDRVLVLGGTSLIADYLLPRLLAACTNVTVAARRPVAVPEGVTVQNIATARLPGGMAGPTAVVSLLPLAVLADLLPRFAGASRLVAIGSTSVFSKSKSAEEWERAAAAALAAAEATVLGWCGTEGIPGTILRPTLVYDRERDRNIARMVRFIRRARMLPLAAPATGLRQPIHADDVAKAVVAALGTSELAGQGLNIGGAERLTYRLMAERVFEGLGLVPRCLLLPPQLLKGAFAMAGALRLVRETAFGSSVFLRMNQDLVYDTEPGLALLGYSPRPFRPFDPPRPGDQDCTTITRSPTLTAPQS